MLVKCTLSLVSWVFVVFLLLLKCVHVYVCMSSCLHKWHSPWCEAYDWIFTLVIQLTKKNNIDVALKEDVRGREQERTEIHWRMTDEPEICTIFMQWHDVIFNIFDTRFFSSSLHTWMLARNEWFGAASVNEKCQQWHANMWLSECVWVRENDYENYYV